MGGDSFRVRGTGRAGCLNPPRPHGRGPARTATGNGFTQLKSTPPAWAGTRPDQGGFLYIKLKSTPPAWAGTGRTH